MAFHPTEDVLAVNLNNTHVAFYRVGPPASPTLTRLGPAVEVAEKLSVLNWHPGGHYLLALDVAWGRGSLGFVLNGRGHLTSVAFDADGAHRVADELKVGLSPEGFDVSPDGRYAAVANMRRTYLPRGFWWVPARRHASLSLVGIDAGTGALEALGEELPFVGALPEDAVFDAESNTVAVAVFHEPDPETTPERGRVDYYEVVDDRLRRTRDTTAVMRGVHQLLRVP